MLKVLRSNSACNSSLIGDILIDCGLNPKAVVRLSGILPKAVLLTHEHSDHSRLVSDWLRVCPVYATYGTWKALKRINSRNVQVIEPDYEYDIAGSVVEVYRALHESAADPCYFVVKQGKEKVLFSTDNKRIEQPKRKFTTVALEANFDEDIFNKQVLNPAVEKASLTHCSFQKAMNILKSLDLSACEQITLLHLSDRFSKPEMFKSECEKKFGIPTKIGGLK